MLTRGIVGHSKAVFLRGALSPGREPYSQVLLRRESQSRGVSTFGRRIRRPQDRTDTQRVNASPHLSVVAATASVLLLVSYLSSQWWPESNSGLESRDNSAGQLAVPLSKVEESERIEEKPKIEGSMAIPPGRPGNLTPEQEAKLRDFWVAVFRVFGVVSDELAAEVDGAETRSIPDESSTQESGVTDKKRKKRLGLFGKKSAKERESAPEASGGAASSQVAAAGDSDDKFGQTKQFKEALASQSAEDLRKAFWAMVKHDNPDGLLLRFLRARKWDVEKALIMLVAAMHWRSNEVHVDDDVIKVGDAGVLEVARTGTGAAKKEAEDFLAHLRLGKGYMHGVDKEGRPICFAKVRLHRIGEQSEASLERYTVYHIETARLFLNGSVDTAVRGTCLLWLEKLSDRQQRPSFLT